MLVRSKPLVFSFPHNQQSRLRERCKKKGEKKLTSVSFMYVCVAGNGEMLVFFPFSPNNSLIFHVRLGKKGKKLVFTGVYVCERQN